MNAFNTINLAGAVILTSTEHARELGIPESKWIYALGGAGTRDSNDCMWHTEIRRGSMLTFWLLQFGNGQNTGGAHAYLVR